MKILNQSTLNKLIENVTTKKNIFGAVFCVESKDNSTTLISASGNIKKDDQHYIASINKLFISAIILKSFYSYYKIPFFSQTLSIQISLEEIHFPN